MPTRTQQLGLILLLLALIVFAFVRVTSTQERTEFFIQLADPQF